MLIKKDEKEICSFLYPRNFFFVFYHLSDTISNFLNSHWKLVNQQPSQKCYHVIRRVISILPQIYLRSVCNSLFHYNFPTQLVIMSSWGWLKYLDNYIIPRTTNKNDWQVTSELKTYVLRKMHFVYDFD